MGVTAVHPLHSSSHSLALPSVNKTFSSLSLFHLVHVAPDVLLQYSIVTLLSHSHSIIIFPQDNSTLHHRLTAIPSRPLSHLSKIPPAVLITSSSFSTTPFSPTLVYCVSLHIIFRSPASQLPHFDPHASALLPPPLMRIMQSEYLV